MVDSEKVTININGEDATIFREAGGHRFTDEELEKLARGELIAFEAVSGKTGNPYVGIGRLVKDGRFWKFKFDFDAIDEIPLDEQPVPFKWCNHEFTPDERAALKLGDRVYGHFHSNNTGNDFDCEVKFAPSEDNPKRMVIIPCFEESPAA